MIKTTRPPVYFALLLVGLTVGACTTPPPLCDRSAQSWSKVGTQEDACELPPAPPLPCACKSADRNGPDLPPPSLTPPADPPSDPTPPTDPTPPSEPPTEPTPPSKPSPTKGNNGLGNGDQPAPGKSLSRNRAENQVGNPGHPSGKPQKAD